MKQADPNKTFTAADIQRYHAGELSMQERHALEKAALDDPFLADALEGYQHTATPQIDLAALEQRLAQKTAPQRKRVVPLLFPAPWMRAAALFLILAGAGWGVYQFAYLEKENLATQHRITYEQYETPELIPSQPAIDSTTIVKAPEAPTPVLEAAPQAQAPLLAKPSKRKTPPAQSATALADAESSQSTASTAIASAPAESKLSLSEAAIQKEAAASSYLRMKEQQPLHIFKGQILDAQGNPVPNASITVSGKPTGTTTNLQGRFSLTAPDSVLNATVSAVGFEMNRISLKDPAEEKTVILNESTASLSEVVVTGYGTKRSRNARPSAAHTKAEVEELEPENGWTSFNNYIVENLQIPEEVANKKIKGEVELSFDVNKDGEPVNIKVEKSLCASCDKEAIRLLQEGPGWKKKKKKNGKVKIRF